MMKLSWVLKLGRARYFLVHRMKLSSSTIGDLNKLHAMVNNVATQHVSDVWWRVQDCGGNDQVKWPTKALEEGEKKFEDAFQFQELC